MPSARGGEIHGRKHAAAHTHITINRQSTPFLGGLVGAEGVVAAAMRGEVYGESVAPPERRDSGVSQRYLVRSCLYFLPSHAKPTTL